MPMQGPPPGFVPGQQPTPEQIQEIQRRIAEDAQKAGMTVPEFIEHIKRQAQEQQRMRAQQMAMQQQQQQQRPPGHENCDHDHDHEGHSHPPPQQGQGRPQPIVPGPPKPEALALAKFLKSQDLKPRTCILNGERKDMFKGL